MKLNRIGQVLAWLLSASITFAQKKDFTLYFRDGAITPAPNLVTSIDSLNRKSSRMGGRTLAVLQFEDLPSEEVKKSLIASGIQLLDYIPNHAYLVSITGKADINLLKRVKARSLLSLSPQQKMHPALKALLSAPVQKDKKATEVWIRFPETINADEVIGQLRTLKMEVASTQYQKYHILVLRVATDRITELASSPYIEYLQLAPPPDVKLDENTIRGSRANVLNGAIKDGGRNLNGKGIAIGIGDESGVNHIDIAEREINRAIGQDGDHATHVHGIAAGAGIINEQYRGYAPKATVISQNFQNIITNAPAYVQDYGMIATNNSYGIGFNCDYNGTYDLYASLLDEQALEFPYLQHVFAAGNSGHLTCSLFPTGFKTIFGGYQAAKNIICVGNADDEGTLFYSSSKGPVKDGRTKPDLVADGTAVISTWPANGYATDWGTSMSAPAVTGGLALLNQRYRQLHNNALPKSALLKALLCNGATDRGNAGVDFSYGYGSMNLLRSLAMLEESHYVIDSSTNGSVQTRNITVPANTAALKVMLYWNDPASALISSQALVNDLDLEVTDVADHTILPQLLDTAIGNLPAVATTGEDHINNMEQVIIANPASGTYTVKVKGTSIAKNPAQEYVMVYDIIPASLQLTYPAGGEGLVPGETTKISWEAYGDAGTFTLQYSLDNGATWNAIANAIAADKRFFTWQVPATATDKALVRLTKENSPFSSTSHPFTIIGVPVLSLAPVQCEGYIGLTWQRIDSATDYEIMQMKGGEMITADTTTATAYTLNSLAKDSTYWVSVRARIRGKGGRRAQALSRQPNTGTCSGTISDNDLKVDAIISPTSGRENTSTALTTSTPVTVQIRNLDDAAVTGFTLSYSTDGTNWIKENVPATIAAGGLYTHTFVTPVDFSKTGVHPLAVAVQNAKDTITANDTLTTVIKQLENAPLNLVTPFIDDLENTPVATYTKNTIGLTNKDRYDFITTVPDGELRTFVNTGIAASGQKAFTLDKTAQNGTTAINNLLGTFNLANYNPLTNDIRLDFKCAFAGQIEGDTSNSVWIRGNDTLPWIKVISLKPGRSPSLYSLSRSVEVSDSLAKYGQAFSSSFQVCWGQAATQPGSDKTVLYSIDDIHLYTASHDLQVLSIDSLMHSNCGLPDKVPLQITVRNSDNITLQNVPLKYSVNGGSWITEVLPVINGKTTTTYTFHTPLNLAAPNEYTIKAIVDYPSDTYRANDTVTAVVYNAPVITSFPYLQNFETGKEGWYAEGTNSTWAYGTPASLKINKAASGTKAWKTNLSGNYNDAELSYLYSPCFTIGGMQKPTLSFHIALDVEDCGNTLCDAGWVEYSADGKSWQRLSDVGSGTNWYNAQQNTCWSIEGYTRWHVATVALPLNVNSLRLRFVMASDEGVNKEGIAIDDIHIYDNVQGIYNGPALTATAIQGITGGASWSHFEKDGKLLISIQPNGQNLGTTSAQVYINRAKVRDTLSQYYLDRSFVVKPSNRTLKDSVSVRLYFLDSELEALLHASGCMDCDMPSDITETGVSKYNNKDTAIENESLADNIKGSWQFFNSPIVCKVPFDKGYYCEFKVKDFSEFWFSKKSIGKPAPLPVTLLNFSAQKTAAGVTIIWEVTNEQNVDSYVIEVAKSNADLSANHFLPLQTVMPVTRATVNQYTATDAEKGKKGVRYYRLKIVNDDGSIQYSDIRPIVFSESLKWTVYPNPSSGKFQLMYQLNAGEIVNAKITDITGRVVQGIKIEGNGFVQKKEIDLSAAAYASGTYLLQVSSAAQNGIWLYKL